MVFALPVSRRAVLSGAVATGTALIASSAYAHGAKVSKVDHARNQALFAQLMVRGPFAVKTANPLSFQTQPDRNLLVRVTYPDPSDAAAPATMPVVVFSHGALASKDSYDQIADLWASHGIATILPTHIDSQSLGYQVGQMEQIQVLAGRIADLGYLIDHMEDVARQTPALAGRFDKDHIGIGGHGFGVMPALCLAGLRVKAPSGQITDNRNPRVKALVSYNGIGPLPFLDDNWGDITVPVFAASGTNDAGSIGGTPTQPWRWRMSPYTLTHGKERYGLSVTAADHAYGGLIGLSDHSDKSDATGLAIINAMTTAFIHATLDGDKASESFLKTADVSALTENRAFLERA